MTSEGELTVTTLSDLERIVGKANIRTGAAVAEIAIGILDPSPTQALAIVYPGSTDEVSAILNVCHKARQPIVVQGGRSGAVGGHVAAPDEIALSLEKMNKVENIDRIGCTATVEAGCILQTFQEEVERNGLDFPLDLGGRGSCTIGGNISTNAGGIRVVRFGMMREQVLGLEAVLADGTIISSMNQVIKNNSGYDLKQLFIGSEGTLGVVTRAVLRLRQRMKSTNLALLAVNEFDHILQALQICEAALGGQMTAFELMSGDYYKEGSVASELTSPLPPTSPWFVIVESQGIDEDSDREKLETTLSDLLERELVADAVIAKSLTEMDHIWSIRENIQPFIDPTQPFFIYDVSVPRIHMEHYIQTVRTSAGSEFPNGTCYAVGHVADCNIHFVIVPNSHEEPEELHRRANELVYAPLGTLNGAISAEHGVGFEKKPYLALSRNKNERRLMHLLKQTLDPQNILGRGRIFDLP